MKVLVFPRSPNPYQAELYASMRTIAPLTTRYAGELTPSQTLNVLLLPLELVACRARGFRVLHVHWVYPFGLVWARARLARRLMRIWFGIVLRAAAVAGIRIVWTAHNLLPHEPVFDEDEAARRALVRRCRCVIAHSDTVAAAVRGWGASDVTVVPPGFSAPVTTLDRAAACERLGLVPGRFRVLHFGIVRAYKGVDTLLDAASMVQARAGDTDRDIDGDGDIEVVVVGECLDVGLRAALSATAAGMARPDRVHLRFEHVSDDELDAYLAASDVAAFPFRDVTSSSSVGRALAAGTPVIVPALAVLTDVPAGAAVRYRPADGPAGLADAIAAIASVGPRRLDAMGFAARSAASAWTWPDAAARTWSVMERADARRPARMVRPRLRAAMRGAR